MKTSSAFKLFLPLFIVVFAFTSCDMDENPVGTFGEAVERVPEVQLIEGADNATINVKYDRNYSYFTVEVSNIGHVGDISDGIYNAWCIQMEQPLSTNQDHQGTRLYNTISDKTFNKLSYIVNNRRAYERDLQGLSWKDIQVAMWVILETSDLKLGSIAEKIPSSVEGYNRDNVNSILSDVQSNGSNFTPGAGDIKLVMANASGNEQDIVLEKCETAFGGDSEGSGPAWWYYYDASEGGVQTIWAGQHIDIGTVEVVNGTVYITLKDGWILQPYKLDEDGNVKVDENEDPVEETESVKIKGYDENHLPQSRPAAGQFPHKGTELTVDVGEYDYYVIHLDVCKTIE